MPSSNHAYPGPDTIARRELSNGLVVLVRESHLAPSVVITGSLEAGSLFDPPDQDGLASFTASMVMRGTKTRDFAAIHELLEGNGASLSIEAGRHSVGFGGKSLGEDLPLLLDLLSDALRNPVFPPDHVERLRGQTITAIRVREQSTRYMAGRAFRKLAYPASHPYSRDTTGQLETVSAMTRDQLVAYHAAHFGPKGMRLVIVGAVDTEAVFQLVEEKLGDWSNPRQPDSPELPELAPLETACTEMVSMRGKSQADLVLGIAGPSRFADDWRAAELANSILGVFGMYGRIGTIVREQQGMAYYSYSHLEGGLGPGAWRVIAGVNPANLDRAVTAIRDEIRRITSELVSEEELADSKANFIGRMPLMLERNEGVAGVILTMERYGLGLDYLRHYADSVRAVTPDDALAAAQHYLDPDVYALAVAGPV
ncbi:MAG: insulinase family protein [Anaerolineae bacterium]|nr:insulinase family protein [Anaerolineae bacterium]